MFWNYHFFGVLPSFLAFFKRQPKQMSELETKLLSACRAAEKYLLDRGVGYRGVEGRTKLLPQLRDAIESAESRVAYDQRALESD